ncbi:ABC transporter permease/substrate-binding protein [Sphingomonas sp. SRS2]|uniref:ABC transporter permease/substrate-binding protein n=1 Tax=Sphingomonas sp. SRS2 TaxID=133190 RepID=UPI000618401B|nr:ABC transporter permease/substrate-binding protein [Sphingomonas sp. SRS2]KKC27247.1 ABC transporter permease [Sphingomonas sp. SRS2]
MADVAALLVDLIPDLAAHLLLAAAAMLLGLAIALPLILLSARTPSVARISLALAGIIQTIPALALLALFYPVLLWLSTLVGRAIPALGFLPALLALSLYAVLPVLRNGVTGLKSLDPAILEAADGVGMTARQKLWWVEAPLVAPILMAGIRTAMVWTIGAATLSTTVGQQSLGDPIFAGLQTQNWSLVLAGCLLAAMLALAVDMLLALVERGVTNREPVPIAIGVGVLAVAVATALAPVVVARPVTITVGAKNFSEQYILAQLIGSRLEGAGFSVRYRTGLGSAVIYRALRSDDVDVYVEYAGTLWTNEMRRSDTLPPSRMIPAIDHWLRDTGGVRLVGQLGFENAYAFAMRGADARHLHIGSIEDLAKVAPSLKLGTDLEFLEKPEWRAVKQAYPLVFKSTRAYSPTFMYKALQGGDVDVISAFSSDGRIAADGLRVLTDPRGAMPRYDALLLVAPGQARNARLIGALSPLADRIDIQLMRRANYLVDRSVDKRTPAAAAHFLSKAVNVEAP